MNYALSQIKATEIELNIPEYLDKEVIKKILQDATILWQEDNGHNYCVLAIWPDKERVEESMVYFSRFFVIGNRTHVSHDASASGLIDAIVKLAGLANRYFEQ